MASLPPVKLDTHEDWFNLLMTVLHQQAEQNPYEEYRGDGSKADRPVYALWEGPLLTVTMRPAWRFGCTRRRPEIPSGCLLLSLCNQYDPDKDYSAELKAAKKE